MTLTFGLVLACSILFILIAPNIGSKDGPDLHASGTGIVIFLIAAVIVAYVVGIRI